MLCLHLLQASLVHLNTLLVQNTLARPEWADRLTEHDRRALSPLFWQHVNPYGTFRLDLDTHLRIDPTGPEAARTGPAEPQQRTHQPT